MLLLLLSNAAGAASSEAPFRLFYQGRETLILQRLELDPSTRKVSQLAGAQAAVYQGELPSPGAQLDELKACVESGMGLLIVLGNDVDPVSLKTLTDGAIEQTGMVDAPLGPSHGAAAEKIAASIEYVGPKSDLLNTQISWKSAVRVHERSLLKLGAGATVLVGTTSADPIRPATPILLRTRVGKGTVYVLNVRIEEGDLKAREHSYRRMLQGAQSARNYDFQRFFFFNYLLYCSTRESAGVMPVRFGRWVAAPVPGARTIAILLSVFLLILASIAAGFIAARRYSKRHPEQLENLYLAQPAQPKPASLGAAAIAQEDAEAAGAPRGDPRWEIVGFHRPLSGFLYNYLLNLVLMIPFNFVTTFWLDRTFVNPFLEARGAGAAVAQLMLFLVPLLDLGTSQAMVKYFAEYRVNEPGRAISYVQFFIWFHLILGILALAVLGLVGAVLLPNTMVAYLSWFVVLDTMTAFPPFYPVFFNLFRALQRFDYAQLMIVLFFVMNPLVAMACAIYGRHWGLMHPVFGEGMGVVMGFAAGAILGNLLLGVISASFYHQTGFKLVTIVLAHFDADAMKKSLVYGAKLTAGTVMPFLSWGLVPVIMGSLLPNFLELNEIWLLTYSLTFAYLEGGVYIFATLMPAVSEAYSQNMRLLTQRYLDQGLRWGLMVTAMMGGAYVAFSDAFIRGLLPPQFIRAIGVMALIHVFRVFDFATRMPDQVFMGAGRTGTFTWTAIVEHVGRIVLSWYLIKWFGFAGLFYAFIASAALKSLLAWPLMAKMVVEPVFSVWQTFLNPGLAAIGNYLILRAIVDAMWRGPGHLGNTWLVVLICLLGSFPIYMFFSGLLGWDDTEMTEFKDAVDLVPAPFRSLAAIGYEVVRLGTRISPLHRRFPAKLADGIREAAILTASKATLH